MPRQSGQYESHGNFAPESARFVVVLRGEVELTAPKGLANGKMVQLLFWNSRASSLKQ